MTTPRRETRRRFLARTAALGAAGLVAPHAMTRLSEAAAPQDGYRVGIYTRPWDQHDYRVALDAAADAGFKHVGLMTTKTEGRRLVIQADTSLEDCERIGREVKSRGMSIPSIYGGGIPVAKSLEAGIEGVKRLVDNCAAAGARSLLMGGTNEKLFDVYYKAIAEACDYAAEKNVPITVKPHGGGNATGPQCRKCVETVGHANFSIWYDPGNIFFYSEGELDPVDDAATVDGLVKVGMCIKDFCFREEGGERKRDVWLTPGTGMVDFPTVLARLKKGGFTGGDLVIECVTRPDPTDLKATLAEAKKARETDLKAILAEAKKAREFVEGLIAG